MSIFITGTDTGVGKTRVAALLVRALRAAGTDAVGFKPICCGGREDAVALAEASALNAGIGSGAVALNDVNPVWLRPPVAPYAAAMIEGRSVDLALVREKVAQLRAAHAAVIVEGAGGWLVPVTRDFSMADLAAEFALPVLVIAANRLGVINHTLLTVAAIRASGLECAGVVLNHPHSPQPDDPAVVTNAGVLGELLAARPGGAVPLLGEIEFGAEVLPPSLCEIAR
ncbi:MAG: dethiobiotin synthase [Chthoniobacteraceae bacterium]